MAKFGAPWLDLQGSITRDEYVETLRTQGYKTEECGLEFGYPTDGYCLKILEPLAYVNTCLREALAHALTHSALSQVQELRDRCGDASNSA